MRVRRNLSLQGLVRRQTQSLLIDIVMISCYPLSLIP
jgi:hypothetical protein